ncbi:MAG: veratrol--corrinoid protein metyltransferase [Eubacteriaceae bacterium]|nr:veratrol--corrinoid protein metyltransferase [Eubacteriaceae bacterium]
MRTPKENYLGIAKGIIPDYVPHYTMGMPLRVHPERTPTNSAGPTQLMFGANRPGLGAPATEVSEYTNIWGVPYVTTESTGFAGLPKPDTFIVDDIYNWEKIVKKPDIDTNVDWEAMANEAMANINRETTAVTSGFSCGTFTTLIGLMGFTEGLCALLEEPEKVIELLNFITDYYEPIAVKTLEYFKPDIVSIGDDTASKYAPFFSPEVYRQVFKPQYNRVLRYAKERDIPVQFHNCGKCEQFVDDMVDLGVRFWDPAQTENDLVGIMEKYNGTLAVCGGFDYVPDVNGATEEAVRAYIRETLDKYAPGGGYAFTGGYVGTSESPEFTTQVNTWIADEVYNYGSEFYK